jgi:anaerobic ribonucleoside-triphosphate reductase activating protein
MSSIRIAGIVRESIVVGPGIRFVVFAQGCSHHCKGCHNPETHDFAGGYDCDIETILDAIGENPMLDGVTFSGGEPFCQPEAFNELAIGIRERYPKMNITIYTGYTYEQLAERSRWEFGTYELLRLADYLIDGRYMEEERDLTLQFRGSRNQRIIDLRGRRNEQTD